MTTATVSANWKPSDSLANRLRLVRMELDLTQAAAADKVGITPRVWQNAEDGRSIRSERAVITAIAFALGVDRDWLAFGGSLNAENPHPDNPDGGQDVRQQGLEPRTRWSGVTRLDQRRPPSIPPVKTSLPNRRAA